MITPSIKSTNVQRVNTVDFYMSCVSPSRPCLLQGMAKTWPAFEKWAYKNDGMTYLAAKIGAQTEVDTFVDTEALPDFYGLSFDNTYAKRMNYGDFQNELSENPSGAVMHFTDFKKELK